MRSARGAFKTFCRRASWLLFTKMLLSLVLLAYAATITVSTSSYQAEVGSYTAFPSGLIATDKGFSASTTGWSTANTNCSSAVTFGLTPGKANTTIAAGHLVYDVQVNATILAPTNHPFNVTLVVGSTTYGPICIKTLVPPVTETIDCRFDVGTSLPASPYTFKVTVQ